MVKDLILGVTPNEMITLCSRCADPLMPLFFRGQFVM
jgi:hypothetical protein